MQLSLENKTAVICGASQGIGLAAASELALLGANCILLARNVAPLEAAVQSLDRSKDQQHGFFAVDMLDLETLQALATAISRSNRVHILVNNSGGPAGGPITEATAEAFENTFRQHVLAAHTLVQAFLPGMQEAGYGRIIQVISTSVKTPLHNLGVSNTVRAAMAGWSKTLSNEVAQYGITVNNVLPGATKTGRLDTLIKTGAAKRAVDQEVVENEWKATIPAQRFGEPEEVGALVAFLATPAAAYITGTNIPVDGGRTPAF
jgi:3-oxoacyl-[acyl-carrier protein] reductase